MNMKTIFQYTILVCTIGLFWACEADGDEGLPSFDNSLPLYVQLGNVDNNNVDGDDTSSPEEGDEFTVEVEIPEAIYSDVNVQWEVTGDITGSGSVVIPEGSLTSEVVIAIPDGAGAGNAAFTLTSVDNGLTLGRQNASTSIITTDLSWAENN
jgi:hypothetical protein